MFIFKKRSVLLIVIASLFIIHYSVLIIPHSVFCMGAPNIWDADGDGKISLSDIIGELQVIAGVRTDPGEGFSGYVWDIDKNMRISLADVIGGLEIISGIWLCIDADGDGFYAMEACGSLIDCDDGNAAIFPGAIEACNGIDDNCNGILDEGTWLTALFFKDADGDGFGNSELWAWACDSPPGYAPDGNDCNDDDAFAYPGASEICNARDDNCNGQIDEGLTIKPYYKDADGDGFGRPDDIINGCGPAEGYVENALDCNDNDSGIHPEALELCNQIDDNCNGAIDEGERYEFYRDADKDGYGNPALIKKAVCMPDGFVADNTDCDDTNAGINVSAAETCNSIDDNCNGQIDEGVTSTYYKDADGDGFGDPAITEQACSAPTGFVANNIDCNDADALIYPGAPETCNEKDDDCDSIIDEGVLNTYYIDADGDGYGNAGNSVQYCKAPSGYVDSNTDCNDNDPLIHPNQTETCNQIDDNCSGQIDEGVPTNLCYGDADRDGYGNPNNKMESCYLPPGYVAAGTDCNDDNAAIYPGAAEICNGIDDDCDQTIDEDIPKITYYQDADADGYGNPNVKISSCSQPDGYVIAGTDCDDTKPEIRPGAAEICNGIDDDCDNEIDEGIPQNTYYKDADADGYGDPNIKIQSCSKPLGYVNAGTDCNDNNPNIHPGKTEFCNGIDDDCNNMIDDGITQQTYYRDNDGDGYGSPNDSIQSCNMQSGYVTNSLDCNDLNPSVCPGRTEICNQIDDNCNGAIDEGVTNLFYRDADGDGYGNLNGSIQACNQPSGYVTNSLDCNDSNSSVYPGRPEICNGIDDDCDQTIDEGLTQNTYYRDSDGDGYGNLNGSIQACNQPSGYVTNSLDCNDSNSSVYPGRTEICNGIDDDCDQTIDEGLNQNTYYRDYDGDGYGNPNGSIQACTPAAGYVSNNTDCNDSNPAVCPGRTEICNGIDDDCDQAIDEGVTQYTYYRDYDGDGYGNPNNSVQSCSKPSGYVTIGTDCNDSSPSINPGRYEICNGIDDDCDQAIDEGLTQYTYYRDYDGDGYGNPNNSVQACSKPSGYVSVGTDCNDSSPSINPGRYEICNGIDDDCDQAIDEGLTQYTYYRDYDGDGYGNPNNSVQACSKPSGYVTIGTDCNDSSPSINPGRSEICNSIDDDCNGIVDEGCGQLTTFYRDYDGDGYGNPSVSIQSVSLNPPSGYAINGTDCNDINPSVNPGRYEICNQIDDNCNGTIDEGLPTATYYRDYDGDGYGDPNNPAQLCSMFAGYVSDTTDCDDTNSTVYPGAPEDCSQTFDSSSIKHNCDWTWINVIEFCYFGITP